ncbi:ABC transporter ATP-binding protein [Mucilaginibacter sp. PPCGB 2223]|uniref:ABC transporter ATP-binding protein n=1 Tax=Mucilaginibacter sp. PPCGB 2223 TaxID=1886027 RepID=UPI000826FBEA|nr:ABC transporter ATP-binding protein [Mucilaginibacter sp. PPCGB 2223]OCX51153.1 ABC transporter ATP-binding protein [Mucilaginibacter sp. PPCGB 2223]
MTQDSGLKTQGFKISLENIGRRFNREWIFRDVNYTFNSGAAYAILGPNGSGKSTLLQILNGSLTPSAGKIVYEFDGKAVEAESVYQYLSLAAPYMELIEDFTLAEMITFHFKFKKIREELDTASVIDLLNLQASKDKAIKYFSSGMKQRTKLALAFCADTPVLMLDEPTSNLDAQGADWYLNLAERFSKDRLTVICSNQPSEYGFCSEMINITDYKK